MIDKIIVTNRESLIAKYGNMGFEIFVKHSLVGSKLSATTLESPIAGLGEQ
jgi:hypothetical protein